MAGQKAFLCGGRCTHFTPAQFWQDFTLTPQRFAANYTPCVKKSGASSCSRVAKPALAKI